MSGTIVEAPAKINLGLEILGRRDDGYHEIRSVLATISLRDTLTFESSPGPRDDLRIDACGDTSISGTNLILSALEALRAFGADIPPQAIRLQKRIPVASGLGGASSDAAAVLKHFGSERSVPVSDLFRIGATLGSDVPFFLGAPFAMARGRGDVLSELPSPVTGKWVVTVTPDLLIPTKTATMYAAVERDLWSPGDDVERFAASFPDPPNDAPANAFANALFHKYPHAAAMRDRLLALGFPAIMVSGAGPTMFALCVSEAEAARLARLAATELPSTLVHTSRLGFEPNCRSSRMK